LIHFWKRCHTKTKMQEQKNILLNQGVYFLLKILSDTDTNEVLIIILQGNIGINLLKDCEMKEVKW